MEVLRDRRSWQLARPRSEYLTALLGQHEVLIYHVLSRNTWLIDSASFEYFSSLSEQPKNLNELFAVADKDAHLDNEGVAVNYLEHLEKSGLVKARLVS